MEECCSFLFFYLNILYINSINLSRAGVYALCPRELPSLELNSCTCLYDI